MLTGKLEKELISAFHTEEVPCSRYATATANIAKASKVSNTWFFTFHNKQTNYSSDQCYFNPDYTSSRSVWFNTRANETDLQTH